MCLIALAHRVSAEYPLILAANRDEDYERPSLPADFWPDAPDVFGGRDALMGGSWLAVSRSGRFAAVTNLRGAERAAHHRSRGALVRDFVTGDASPVDYATAVGERSAEYTGFHLYVGETRGDLMLVSGRAIRLSDGIHALSNAPDGERWPKVDAAVEEMRRQDWRHPAAAVDALMRFLQTGGSGDPRRDVFIKGDRYGTRCSTVVVASAREILFVEQGYARGGEIDGRRRERRIRVSSR